MAERMQPTEFRRWRDRLQFEKRVWQSRGLVGTEASTMRLLISMYRGDEDSHLSGGYAGLDNDLCKAFWDEREVVLTATELGVLRTLLGRPGTVFSRERLMDAAYPTERVVSDRTIDSHVRRVRAKFAALDAAPVETVHGLGYKLGPCR